MSRLIVVIVLVLLVTRPAYAYLDPGTGSVLVQALVAALAVVSAAVATFWTRLRQILPGRRRRIDRSADGSDRGGAPPS